MTKLQKILKNSAYFAGVIFTSAAFFLGIFCAMTGLKIKTTCRFHTSIFPLSLMLHVIIGLYLVIDTIMILISEEKRNLYEGVHSTLRQAILCLLVGEWFYFSYFLLLSI
jgi:hypothetical protein